MFRGNKVFKFGENRMANLVILLFVLLWTLLLGTKGYAAEREDFRELYDKARKEGTVVFYASMELVVARDLAIKFEKKYPGIKVEVSRNASERLLIKVLTEARAGKYFFDVIQSGFDKVGALRKSSLLAKYDPSSRQLYPKGFIDPESYWTSVYYQPCTIVYNNRLVKLEEVPQTWEGLLDPKWKGKLAMDSSKYSWSNSLGEIWGEEKKIKFLRDLSTQKITFRAGLTNLHMLLAAGEYPIMVYAFATTIARLKEEGASVDWVRMKSPTPTVSVMAAVAERAPHPNAARLFYEFLLSKEGQEVIAASDKPVPRTDVEPLPLIREIKKLDLVPDRARSEAEYQREAELFRKVFGL